MTVSYIVRRANGTQEDFDLLTGIAREAFAASRYADNSFAVDRVRQAIEAELRNKKLTVGFLLVSGERETVHGALIAIAGPLTAAKAIICNAPLFYVLPKARASNAGSLLLQAYLNWARSIGAFDASVPVLSGHHDIARVGNWLERKGLKHTGDNFSKQI